MPKELGKILEDPVARRHRRASLALRQTRRPPGREARSPEGRRLSSSQVLINDANRSTVVH